MKSFVQLFFVLNILLLMFSCRDENPVPVTKYTVDSVRVNKFRLQQGVKYHPVPVDSVVIDIFFSSVIDTSKLNRDRIYINSTSGPRMKVLHSDNARTLRLQFPGKLNFLTAYNLYVSSGENLGGQIADDYQFTFITEIDSVYKFPVISDDSLLTLVQKQTFRYFWEYGHPVSGLARERSGSGETVTSGGSGFGIMTIPVAIERKFITRQQGFERINKTVSFLYNKADRFHGVFSHWLNGTSGKVQPFSTKDNGADLVETAFLMQGLLTVQQYFKDGNVAEKAMCDTIQKIWEGVEWNWFQQNGQQKLFWHWSPTFNWDINMAVSGWNETLIVYVLAASSPTHAITKSVYENGFARNGALKNGKSFYNILLPLGEDKGGPLFFAHYSFLGLNPHNLSDRYADYFTQNSAHARINYRYCVENPGKYYGYSADCWGLTASDISTGYTASSPNNDGGTIAPTAALASFPYTPEESMQALHFFYYILGDKLFGEYGFKDAFNLNQRWFADSYLAIDQGPEIVMIENYRTGLLWKLFMQNKNVQSGLTGLGFNF